MNSQQMVKPALIAGVVLVALVFAGLPVAYLGLLLLILACPVMMFFMMRGMGGMGHGGSASHDHASDDQVSPGRPGGR